MPSDEALGRAQLIRKQVVVETASLDQLRMVNFLLIVVGLGVSARAMMDLLCETKKNETFVCRTQPHARDRPSVTKRGAIFGRSGMFPPGIGKATCQ